MRPDEIGAAITLLGRAIRNELSDEATGEECRLAQEFGFAPLLFFRRRGRFPEPFATSLRGIYRARSQRMMPMGFALKEVKGLLDGAGVRYLPIKGAALLEMATYPDQALRAMCDLDFWVHPDDCEKAASQLKSSGWRVQQAIRNEHHIPGLVKKNVCVELHYDLPGLEGLSPDWFDRLPRNAGGRAEASVELHFLILFYHAVEHEWHNLARLLADAGMLFYKPGLDFGRLDELAAMIDVASPRLLFEAFPELTGGASPQPETLPAAAARLRETAIENYLLYDPEGERIPLAFTPLRINWWRQRLYRLFSVEWIIRKYGLKRGDNRALMAAYCRDWLAKLGDISSMVRRTPAEKLRLERREKLLEDLYPTQRPERKF